MDREGDMGTNLKRHVGGVNLERLGQSLGQRGSTCEAPEACVSGHM